jgi:hypothetical protein
LLPWAIRHLDLLNCSNNLGVLLLGFVDLSVSPFSNLFKKFILLKKLIIGIHNYEILVHEVHVSCFTPLI